MEAKMCILMLALRVADPNPENSIGSESGNFGRIQTWDFGQIQIQTWFWCSRMVGSIVIVPIKKLWFQSGQIRIRFFLEFWFCFFLEYSDPDPVSLSPPVPQLWLALRQEKKGEKQCCRATHFLRLQSWSHHFSVRFKKAIKSVSTISRELLILLEQSKIIVRLWIQKKRKLDCLHVINKLYRLYFRCRWILSINL